MLRKIITIFTLALVICLSMTPLSLAFANEPTQQIGADGNLTYTQKYLSTEGAPTLPESVSRSGDTFSLLSTSAAVDSSYEKPRQYFTYQASSQVSADGVGNWTAFFPASYPINEGEYQGSIGLDPTTPFTVAERYQSYLVQVDKQVTISGLPDNNVARLPEYMDFEVVSSSTPGATMINTLKIVYVTYEIAGRDHLGLPNDYTAFVTYRGQEGLHEIAFYDVIANYSGELESSIDQMVLTGIYTPDTAEIQRAATTTIDTPEVPLASPGFPIFPLAVASAAIAVFLAIPLLYFFVMSNARLVRIYQPKKEDEDLEGNKKAGSSNKATAELVCRRRLVLRDGIAVFRIPAKVDIFDGGLYSLTISPSLAIREGDIELTWQGKIVAAMPIARHIDVNFKQMLITATEAALMEAKLLD